ncbi:hypothetical protein U1Q18_008951 [Sarracenia purpurea var. burkii]
MELLCNSYVGASKSRFRPPSFGQPPSPETHFLQRRNPLLQSTPLPLRSPKLCFFRFFRPHRPRFHVWDFLVPGLDKAHGFENAQVIFNVMDRNPNHKVGIYYDAMQVTLYYKGQSIGGTSLSFPFYQEPKNTTMLYSILRRTTLTLNNQRWMEFRNDRTGGMVVFRIRITSTIRFKVSVWDTKSHRMHANCDVGVGSDGSILTSYKGKRCQR